MTSGAEICIRKASSYCEIRVTVSGSPIASACQALSWFSVSSVSRRPARSMPWGLERKRTGSPGDRHWTP